MTDKSKTSRPKRKAINRGGRPTRAEATRKALAQIHDAPADIDPRAVLKSIAQDTSAPASARVAAARALMSKSSADDGPDGPDDAVTRLALRLLAGNSK